MKKIQEFIEKKIAPLAKKIAKDPRIKAMQSGFFATIALTVIGSASLLLMSPAVSSEGMNDGIIKSIVVGWEWIAATFGTPLSILYQYTIGCMNLYVVAGTGAALGKNYKMNPNVTMVVALFSFFTSCCISPEGPIGIAYVDATGLFSGLIITITSIELLRFLTNKGVGKVDLAKIGVPDALASSMDAILPALIVALVFLGVGLGSYSIFGVALPDVLATVLAPMLKVYDSLGFVLIYWILSGLMWWVGIHDGTLYAAIEGFDYIATGANFEAYEAGAALNAMPYTFANGFWYYYLNYGIFSLCVLCLLSKSKQIKTVGKIAFIPSLFNVGEPIFFGLPILFNPTFLIPQTFTAAINAGIAFIFTRSGLINSPFFYPEANFMPNPILVFIETLDIKAVIMTLGLIVLDAFIWLPFLKVYEKSCLEQEAAAEAEAIAQKAE